MNKWFDCFVIVLLNGPLDTERYRKYERYLYKLYFSRAYFKKLILHLLKMLKRCLELDFKKCFLEIFAGNYFFILTVIGKIIQII